jgi:hypothetical protein
MNTRPYYSYFNMLKFKDFYSRHNTTTTHAGAIAPAELTPMGEGEHWRGEGGRTRGRFWTEEIGSYICSLNVISPCDNPYSEQSDDTQGEELFSRNEKMKIGIGNKGLDGGSGLTNLLSAGMVLVLVGITFGVGMYINSQIGTNINSTATVAVSPQMAVLGNATGGMGQMASWLPIIAIVLAASAVITTLIGTFSFTRQDGV